MLHVSVGYCCPCFDFCDYYSDMNNDFCFAFAIAMLDNFDFCDYSSDMNSDFCFAFAIAT